MAQAEIFGCQVFLDMLMEPVEKMGLKQDTGRFTRRVEGEHFIHQGGRFLITEGWEAY